MSNKAAGYCVVVWLRAFLVFGLAAFARACSCNWEAEDFVYFFYS